MYAFFPYSPHSIAVADALFELLFDKKTQTNVMNHDLSPTGLSAVSVSGKGTPEHRMKDGYQIGT